MTTFIKNETVVIKGTVKDSEGVLVMPNAFPAGTRITILDPLGVAVVDDEAVTYGKWGIYHYLYNPSGDSKDVVGVGVSRFNKSTFNTVRYNEGGGPVAIIPALGTYHVRVVTSDGRFVTLKQSMADSEFFLVD